MTNKVRTTIYLDKEVVKKAKEIGLNLSQFCENALKKAIRRLEAPYYPPDRRREPKIVPVSNQKGKMVDRAGFEPAASALQARRSYQTDLPAQPAFETYGLSLCLLLFSLSGNLNLLLWGI